MNCCCGLVVVVATLFVQFPMDEVVSLVVFYPDAAAATILHSIVDTFDRVVACGSVGLVLARIRADTLVGVGTCFFWPEFMVNFVLPLK